MKKTTAALLALVLAVSMLLTSCGGDGFILASTPDADLQAELDEILAKYIACYEEGNAKGAIELFTSDFETTEESIAQFFVQVKETTESPFSLYETYYVKGVAQSEETVKIKKNKTDENYIEILPGGEDIVCALFLSEGEKVSKMMSVILTKDGEAFKIAYINPGVYKIKGEDANVYFEKTKALQSEEKFVAAYMSSCMLNAIMQPGGYLRYPDNDAMDELCYNMFLDIYEKMPLPYALEGTSNSSVGEINVALEKDYGLIPHLIFKTDVKIGDKKQLAAEAQLVIEALEKLSPGIRDSFEYIRMEATNDELGQSADIKTEKIILPLK